MSSRESLVSKEKARQMFLVDKVEGKMKQASMTLYREDLNEDFHVDDASHQ
jgi:hypothetical protein